MAGAPLAKCVVRGRWLLANDAPDTRSFTIQPAHGGFNGPVWHGGAEIVVSPQPDGSWSVPLLPSSVLGEYIVTRRGKRFRLVVPERAGVEFADAATPLE